MAKPIDRGVGSAPVSPVDHKRLAMSETAPRNPVGISPDQEALESTLDAPLPSPTPTPTLKRIMEVSESASSAGVSNGHGREISDSVEESGILGILHESESGGSRPPSVSQTGVFPVANWDRYEFLSLLGRGGMGSVYKAMDRRLQRLVALKFVRGDDEHLIARFLQEARSQARINHPGICKVLEVGEVESKPYIAMQYVEGLSLQQAKAQLSQDEKVILIKECAEALHAAHQLGIIHRDVKPSNVMVERREDGGWHPIVMDFGIARDTNDTGITESGTVLGTAAFMSPEQARGDIRKLDPRTDVYSLGATLFDLLAGRPPFVAASTADTLLKVMMEEAPSVRSLVPTVPTTLDTIVNKCLAKEVQQRYGTARELAEDLGRYLAKESIIGSKVSVLSRLRWKARHNRQLAWVAVALVVSVLALLGYGVRTRLQSARMEQQATEQAARLRERAELQAQLTQRLGQEIAKMEWLLRSARQLPLHDLEREKRIVRKQMGELKGELHQYGELAAGLAHYALGRGHLALHEYPESLAELQLANKAGQDEASLHYALGIVLGKHFEQAMYEARLSGGGNWAKKQLKEFEPKYLNPALRSLARARSRTADSSKYLEALIGYYQHDYDRALQQITAALEEAPWLYEATKLAGDIHHERALQARDAGKYEIAEREFAAAVQSYEQAAEVGRSDAEVYEGLAETWIRQMEMANQRGQQIERTYAKAMEASDKISQAEPHSLSGKLKKAFAVMIPTAVYGNRLKSEAQVQLCLTAAGAVLSQDPSNPYARDIVASCHLAFAELAVSQGKDPTPVLHKAIAVLEPALQSHPTFLWGRNELALSYLFLSIYQQVRGDTSAVKGFEKALLYQEQVASLDPEYLFALQNILYTRLFLTLAAQNEAELERMLAHADTVFARCLKINSQFQQCYLNYGEIYARAAQRTFLSGGNAQPRLDRALENLAAARKLGDQFLDLEQFTALAHWVDASLRVRRKSDPTPALKELESALPRCFALAKTDAMCRTLAAQAKWVEGDWARLSGRSALPALKQALGNAIFATQSPEVYPDATRVLAETYHLLAREENRNAANRRQYIGAGLLAVQKVFAVNPNHAAAWATQGALQLLRAETEPGVNPREQAQIALASFEQALRLDPMLTTDFVTLSRKARLLATSH